MIADAAQASQLAGKVGVILANIGLPMAAGYLLRRSITAGGTDRLAGCRRWSKRLKLVCIAGLLPPVIVTAMIKRPISGSGVATMASIGLGYMLIAAAVGRIFVGLSKMADKQAGALFGCVAMTNMVSIGGMVVFAFWGNDGLQQAYLFSVFEQVLYYGVFYPWCSAFNPALAGAGGSRIIASLRKEPATLVPILAVAAGLVLNYVIYMGPVDASGPPEWTQRINRFLVPATVGLLTFAVGLSLRPSHVVRHWRLCVAASVIKFLLLPILVAAVGYGCASAGWISDLGMRVAIVISAMPVAFSALIPPTLYDLDEDLANSCWIVTNALLIVVVPALHLLLV